MIGKSGEIGRDVASLGPNSRLRAGAALAFRLRINRWTLPVTLSACPKCGAKGFRRSRVRFYEAWRKALSGRPYRCLNCRLRVWGQRPADPPMATPPPPWDEGVDLSAIDAAFGVGRRPERSSL